MIGDGSLSSAIAFEGLNNAAEQGGNLIIIVNDNEMSIAEDHGGMYGTLARLRATGGKVGRTCSWRSDWTTGISRPAMTCSL